MALSHADEKCPFEGLLLLLLLLEKCSQEDGRLLRLSVFVVESSCRSSNLFFSRKESAELFRCMDRCTWARVWRIQGRGCPQEGPIMTLILTITSQPAILNTQPPGPSSPESGWCRLNGFQKHPRAGRRRRVRNAVPGCLMSRPWSTEQPWSVTPEGRHDNSTSSMHVPLPHLSTLRYSCQVGHSAGKHQMSRPKGGDDRQPHDAPRSIN